MATEEAEQEEVKAEEEKATGFIEEEASEDPRVIFFREISQLSMNYSPEKWYKMMANDELFAVVKDFLNKGDEELLVLCETPNEILPLKEFPANLKKKGMYFLKLKSEPLKRKGFQFDLMSGDISPSPLEQLKTFVEEVMIPLTCNPANREIWPESIYEDVTKQVQDFKNEVSKTLGIMKGHTTLPMPIGIEKLDLMNAELIVSPPKNDDEFGQLMYAIETGVVQWTTQIQVLVEKDSDSAVFEDEYREPLSEIRFWKQRYDNFRNIHRQLKHPRVEKMARILETTQSCYLPAFKKMLRDVTAVAAEAQDITIHLTPLEKYFERMDQMDFERIVPLLHSIMHVIGQAWTHSNYFRSPLKLINLFQKLGNQIVRMCHQSLDPQTLFQMEINDASDKLKIASRILKEYKQIYRNYRDHMSEYLPSKARPWKFSDERIFWYVNKYLKRLELVEGFFALCQEFQKLEKVEIGGVKGESLEKKIVDIFNEYTECLMEFSNITYDAFDLNDESFVKDNEKFQERVIDWEKRFGAILCRWFDDFDNAISAFQLLQMFSFMLERPNVAADFQKCQSKISNDMCNDMDIVKQMYDEQMAYIKKHGEPLVEDNMPPVAGIIQWSEKLKSRLNCTIEAFKQTEQFFKMDETLELYFKKYEGMTTLLDGVEEDLYKKWGQDIKSVVNLSLEQPLITRNLKTKLIELNFDPKLAAVLREVQYFKKFNYENIPERAVEVHEISGTLYDFVIKLSKIGEWYNKMKTTLLPLELAVIRGEIAEVDKNMKEAESSMKWKNDDVEAYINSLHAIMEDLKTRVFCAKENIERIKRNIEVWSSRPLFERKDGKADALIHLEDRMERVHARNAEVVATGKEIQEVLKENSKLLKATQKSKEWKDYIGHLDQIIRTGFFNAIKTSFTYLIENTDSQSVQHPFFELRMELAAKSIEFVPSINYDEHGNIFTIITELTNDIYNMAANIPRLDGKKDAADYVSVMEDMEELSSMYDVIVRRVHKIINSVNELRSSFDQYSYLWEVDKDELLKIFLTYGDIMIDESIEEHELVPNPPTLEHFQKEIDSFEDLWKEVDHMENHTVLGGWMRVDIHLFKQGLLNVIRKWSLLFKKYLVDHLTSSLKELEAFLHNSDIGLAQQIEEGDHVTLVSVLGHLKAVKDRQDAIDVMFEPLHQTIELLQNYGEEVPDDVHTQLQELPERWTKTKKKSYIVKQLLQTHLNTEATNVRHRYADFDVKQIEFREHFMLSEVFLPTCQSPYRVIDKLQLQIVKVENELRSLHDHASLFEVPSPEFKQLVQCRKEIVLIKTLWDYVFLVNNMFQHWEKSPWREINVDDMELECKKLIKDIRNLDKEMKVWKVHSELEAKVKNMTISLQAVTKLQDPAIKERHWQQLMAKTKVKFVLDEGTTLADLLALNLHMFEEDVREIVDKAIKEQNMEKIISEQKTIWETKNFEFETHPRTGNTLLKPSEDLIEILEDHQVQLQNLATTKHNEHLLPQITDLQKKLGMADQVISLWFDLQHTWSYLESIFVRSEDIRERLPEDSKRFDRVDAEFKKVMEIVIESSNVIAATNKPGLYAKLEELRSDLALCEKALSSYLETKRLLFPRFYFVSASDLLDILSNGNQPELVQRHLTKLFDSIAKLEFVIDDDGQMAKKAKGMYSKDEEYVPLSKECDLSGVVERWLMRLLENMRATVRFQLTDAVASYEDRPREVWLFDYPAQVALVANQIWWTTEVNLAFAKIEEGYENSIKDYNKKQVQQLNVLISMLLEDLTPGNRQKIMTICTIDVHSRDVIAKIVKQKVEKASEFAWQSQLRHRWDEKAADCFANICDAEFRYAHEYLGNSPRLVITPLTDRCYITLTQSLHLYMGGAPAGPAGTGKTETTKDLGRALGCMVYVFNCSEQMDYKSIGNIYKGLAQTGAWGCFDEFNRIAIEVLSVVAVQVKCIQDALRAKKTAFNFLGENISLKPGIGIFITMNPGYAGRTELPENLKALFRPCAMVVPDFEMICEIMLVAEGFIGARPLARKFITLYSLCKELLSKQDHYDWGLRAIKSVLVVAGSLRRDDRERPENQVLMRALRDFNVPKIVSEDIPIFMGLIGDLFPALDVPRKRDPKLEETIKKAGVALKLQPEENFVLKVVQFEELLAVRHSVFVVGNTGTGKSQVCNTLLKTYQLQKRRPVARDLNPKAVTNDELFGIINPATRDWKDGLFSVIMRDLSNITSTGPKWIILDGDIDPMWIESLNTVMDDNKVLTLASNERIALTPSMRLVFEISSLRTATPATVSRAGILYINPGDLGWNPYVTSWIDERKLPSEKTNLVIFFEKYVPPLLEYSKAHPHKITPIAEISHIQMLCYLLDCFLAEFTTEISKELYELYFVFASIWAFGACLFQDQLVDHRVEFSKWWIREFKTVKFPSSGTVFDFYVDRENKRLVHWTEKVPAFELDSDLPLQTTLVHTAETTRVRYFLDILMNYSRPVMLVGSAGSGKTILINEKLEQLSDDYLVTNVPFNFYTTSEMLQKILEKPLEKKAGKNYGPPGIKRMVYFIDDMNMPEVDTYGTVQPHTLIRQHLDYKHWYDRTKLTLKKIQNCQYVACMNPTAGSFTINPRLQRHFCVFAVSFPNLECLQTIYNSILTQHLAQSHLRFSQIVQKAAQQLVATCLLLHQKVSQTFLPTAVKFHYVFNLRDLSNIFQGLLFSTIDCVKTPQDLLRLFIHETLRVYRDKLVDVNDMKLFEKHLRDIIKKNYMSEDFSKSLDEIIPIHFHFTSGIGEPLYMPIKNKEKLTNLLNDVLSKYNEEHAAMNLVLFEDAIQHVCRISRIMEFPRGNALLIGVGGSGKQSLARLAAYISSLESFQITLRKDYGVNELKTDLAVLYQKTGLKRLGIMFLMTNAEIADEKFLVLINDLLASGDIPWLFTDDETDGIIDHVRNEVKGLGLMDTKEICWKFYIDKVRSFLKVVLCLSPVGSSLRIRSRKFPALTNCTCIDWFHAWPNQALLSVSHRFLKEMEVLPEELVNSVSTFMAYVHSSVKETSKVYLANEFCHNYTTPKTFLELINLYGNLLNSKMSQLYSNIQRLKTGIEKLQSTGEQVDALKATLVEQEIVTKQKEEDANKLVAGVSEEKRRVEVEQRIAAEEEGIVEAKTKEVAIWQRDCHIELAKAEPALLVAQAALNTLDKANLTEMKSFPSPPEGVNKVCAAVNILMAYDGNIPKDLSWKASKQMMAKIDVFLDKLQNYRKDEIHKNSVKALQPLINHRLFKPEIIKTQSFAAHGLCLWVLNILEYYKVFCDIEPKRLALEAANADLQHAQDSLIQIKESLTRFEETLKVLEDEYARAVDDKVTCERLAAKTKKTIDIAHRLVDGLSSEKDRWTEMIAEYEKQEVTLPGDVLLISAFVSYIGCFTKPYRVDLMDKQWFPFFKKLEEPIPYTKDLNPLSLLTDEVTIAQWNNEGLPGDKMSVENATILTNSERWPLMIDPQLQGLKWIKKKYGNDLKIIHPGQKGFLDEVEHALSAGFIMLIENIGESLDPILNPLLARNTIKKGRAMVLADKEIELHPNSRLILQTKLPNPHYQPEMQAQTTLINFTVTRDGLEDQLLAEVVRQERPDLEKMKEDLTREQNGFKITLKQLEDSVLARLSAATGNLLDDDTLVEELEKTKHTASEIEKKVVEARKTEEEINKIRELYRDAAGRASLLYFVLNDLFKISPLYQFSLKAFSTVFNKAMQKAESSDNVSKRIEYLIDSITYSTFLYASRGLFEVDKLIFTSQMSLQILLRQKEIDPTQVDFLLRFPSMPNVKSPVDFLTDYCWGAIKVLSDMDEFRSLDKEIEGSAKRWLKFVDSECPEREKFPQEWKNKTALERICMIRCLRPDRMMYAVMTFVEEKLGKKYISRESIEFSKSYEESSNHTPIFFILSPGVNPIVDVETHGKKLGFTSDNGNFHNVSLGQGQEAVAENALEIASTNGHWVILQNIHLVQKWLSRLEKKMEQYAEDSHESFRVFMSAEPSATRESHIIPQGLLESSVKITNEPPRGMAANLHKALDCFTQDTLEICSKEIEFKAILFSLCYFHAVVAERRKFGPQGWNRIYPFNIGDLTISVHVLHNYLEDSTKVPWEDLRYLFGEIMYGGHITDDWDRRLCRTYLEEYMCPKLLEGDLFYAPNFQCPPNLDHKGYHLFITENLPPESPHLYGLHPNAEIGFLTITSENLFKTLLKMQPRDIGAAEGEYVTREDKIKQILEDILQKLPDQFFLSELASRAEDRTPYTVVALQECERMNMLTSEIKRSLTELDLGLKGELTITSTMEELGNSVFLDHVPDSWSSLAYASTLGLAAWFADLLVRARELDTWTSDFILPSSVWLTGLFNPQSFLTAIMQVTSRKTEQPLDKMCLQVEVTKKNREDFTTSPREGAYVHGLFMEGARWDTAAGFITESHLKQLYPQLPVLFIKAILVDKQEIKNIYECPVYKTRQRGPTYVWTFNLKTKEDPAKWIVGGVALLLQI